MRPDSSGGGSVIRFTFAWREVQPLEQNIVVWRARLPSIWLEAVSPMTLRTCEPQHAIVVLQ